MHSVSFSEFPLEILERILLSLPPPDILRMKEVTACGTTLHPWHPTIDLPQPPIGQPPLPRLCFRFPVPATPHRSLCRRLSRQPSDFVRSHPAQGTTSGVRGRVETSGNVESVPFPLEVFGECVQSTPYRPGYLPRAFTGRHSEHLPYPHSIIPKPRVD